MVQKSSLCRRFWDKWLISPSSERIKFVHCRHLESSLATEHNTYLRFDDDAVLTVKELICGSEALLRGWRILIPQTTFKSLPERVFLARVEVIRRCLAVLFTHFSALCRRNRFFFSRHSVKLVNEINKWWGDKQTTTSLRRDNFGFPNLSNRA